jgi:hypothetical protein
MNASVTHCQHLIAVSASILAGLDDSHRALEPRPGAKTAGWLIGHLAVTGDYARKLLGRKVMCPVEWRPLFNPGSQPSTDPGSYPPMATLIDAFRSVYTDLATAAGEADAATLAAANPFGPARDEFPTVGDFVAYLLSAHPAYHLGQLATWRAAAGLGRLRKPGAATA